MSFFYVFTKNIKASNFQRYEENLKIKESEKEKWHIDARIKTECYAKNEISE